MKKKVLVQSLVASATLGSVVVAAPLQARGEQVEQTTTTTQTVQQSFDEVKYQALEQAAISAVEKAKQELQVAADTLAKLEEAAKKEIAGAEKNLADQQAALKAAEAKVAAAKETLKNEQEKLAKAQTRHDDRVAMAEAEIASAEKAIKEKEEPYLAAKEAAEKADATVNEKLAAYQAEQAKQQAIIEEAEAKIKQEEAVYQEAKEAFNQSETTIQDAELELEKTLNEINNQPNVIIEATNEKIAAQHAMEDLLIRHGNATSAYPALVAAAETAKTNFEKAEERQAAAFVTLDNEIAIFQALVTEQEAVLKQLGSNHADYASAEAELVNRKAGLKAAESEKAMYISETAQASAAYTAAQATADAGLAEIQAAEIAYQDSVVQNEVTKKAADEKIAAANEMMNNKASLIADAENKIQSANLEQEKKHTAMKDAEASMNDVTAEQQKIIQEAKDAIAKSFAEVSDAEKAYQVANIDREVKEKEYNTVLNQQQPIIDFASETIKEAKADLQTQVEATAKAQKALDDAEKAVKSLEAAVADAQKNLEAVKADTAEKIAAAKADLAKKETALKEAEDYLAGLRAGGNDARTGKLKANYVGMSSSYQQGYEDAYALLSFTSQNVLAQTSTVQATTVQQKNIYIKEYKKVLPVTKGQLPQTGDAENLAAVLMGLGLITISGAALLKKKYAV
ncbi:LPXTG cell wall anchor domain-containing protein [Enterococcus hulanensis]|uniref:LPXTG cell wall anchor domain-containing protein n=1 Tax=Enterococcus hulanensis TaxID=2559929 RepID=A0ABU3F0L6_9ENTE|nr:LPXTG cell wall anchor domain-containing protein [Enterococcus hulanensis]MDT2600048.1 LPXTG cell wall anchor domain-containing protein [Enterococcus hulanensis]MDT2610122.1 LPXTG cell wall anchor domain-containing protein [Enterococcus hulanensis]MDT2617930.1 LPXTG cell wall anchor domain-containing protein [Enterococcus hulanensis]MDT2629900.1 LPXTG cell wall anchor domain-containing protein [Enterococcus hulanensis]MDT2656495.1 LPXTG cell wall anchor domain-containing protein [Enterococc